jgi:hypothetical protein
MSNGETAGGCRGPGMQAPTALGWQQPGSPLHTQEGERGGEVVRAPARLV